MQWMEVTEARFDEMLGMLPPAVHTPDGFLVGEAVRNNDAGQPMFTAFIGQHGKFYESLEPMTVRQFDALDLRQPFEVVEDRDCIAEVANALPALRAIKEACGDLGWGPERNLADALLVLLANLVQAETLAASPEHQIAAAVLSDDALTLVLGGAAAADPRPEVVTFREGTTKKGGMNPQPTEYRPTPPTAMRAARAEDKR